MKDGSSQFKFRILTGLLVLFVVLYPAIVFQKIGTYITTTTGANGTSKEASREIIVPKSQSSMEQTSTGEIVLELEQSISTSSTGEIRIPSELKQSNLPIYFSDKSKSQPSTRQTSTGEIPFELKKSNRPIYFSDKSESQPSTRQTSSGEIPSELKQSNIPIYFSDTSGSAHSMDYMELAYIWDRETMWDDILQHAADSNENEMSSSQSSNEALGHKLKENNVTIIFHTIPKTASSTLRAACMQTQYDSCNISARGPGSHWPDGYRTPQRMTQLFEICPDTRHFCCKGMPRKPFLSSGFTNFYDTRTFLHLFPFRNYDEWATSALHQVSYRDGEEGCEEMEGLLDKCLPHNYELDFNKYTKNILAEFVQRFKDFKRRHHREVRVSDYHHMLLYGFEHLDETLTWLNESYGVPLLPGTGNKLNSERPKKSCRDEKRMMKKFHDCFSDELTGLH